MNSNLIFCISGIQKMVCTIKVLPKNKLTGQKSSYYYTITIYSLFLAFRRKTIVFFFKIKPNSGMLYHLSSSYQLSNNVRQENLTQLSQWTVTLRKGRLWTQWRFTSLKTNHHKDIHKRWFWTFSWNIPLRHCLFLS